MKAIIITLFAVVMLLAGACTKDEDKWPDAMKEKDLGSAMPYAYFTTPQIFDVADPGNAAVEFVLHVNATNKGKNYNKVILEKSFNDGPFVLHREFLPDEIPATVRISLADAVHGIEGLSMEEIKGGDFFSWRFSMDFPYEVNYQNELLGTFPDFTAFLASTPNGFEPEGTYTMDLLTDDSGTATERITGYTVSVLPGTARSQYMLQDISCGVINEMFGVGNVAYRMHYIGNNSFALHGASEGWPGLIRLTGTVDRDPATGIITVNAVYINSCCGLDGLQISYTLTPE